ncbi:cyclophilin-like fold protein [Streptomyces sp. NPDC046712]|uniref:cyclophilin-like fold protein n=1 Tax=Streptomyces sp. NPDC046712 TaxID=3154802 RepID=UPI0033F26D33
MNIRVTIDGRPVGATLNDSPAARDFAELLPLTLDLEDFHRTERIAYLPRNHQPARAGNPAPGNRPPSTPRRTGPVRPCDHHTPERTKGRPLMDERTASDLRFRTVGTTGFEPATP